MSEIQRYDMFVDGRYMEVAPEGADDGDYVLFTDHEAAIEQAYSDGESSGAADWQLKIIEVIERHDTGGIMSPDAEGIMADLRDATEQPHYDETLRQLSNFKSERIEELEAENARLKARHEELIDEANRSDLRAHDYGNRLRQLGELADAMADAIDAWKGAIPAAANSFTEAECDLMGSVAEYRAARLLPLEVTDESVTVTLSREEAEHFAVKTLTQIDAAIAAYVRAALTQSVPSTDEGVTLNRAEVEPRSQSLVDSWENGYHTGIDAALAALTQKGEPRACTGCANGCAGCKGKGKPYGEELMRQLRQGQKGDNE